jgi:hypothetical protein
LTQPKRRLRFRWNTPKHIVTIILFIIVVGFVEYAIIVFSAAESIETTKIVIPLIDLEISPSFHLLPATVLVSLTACFIHFTTHTSTARPKMTPARAHPQKVHSLRAKSRFKSLRQSWKRVAIVGRRMKNRILQNSSISNIVRQIVGMKPLIKGGLVVIATFTVIVLLVSIAAYPRLVKTAFRGFLIDNEGFFEFIISTLRASEGIANTYAPIGVLATSIQNGLATVAPALKNAFAGAGTMLTADLVSLRPIEKYVLAQNIAVWIVIVITLTCTRHFKFWIIKR